MVISCSKSPCSDNGISQIDLIPSKQMIIDSTMAIMYLHSFSLAVPVTVLLDKDQHKYRDSPQ